MPKIKQQNIKMYAYVENKGTEDEELYVHVVDGFKVADAVAIIEFLTQDLIDNAGFSHLDIQKVLLGEKLKRDTKTN